MAANERGQQGGVLATDRVDLGSQLIEGPVQSNTEFHSTQIFKTSPRADSWSSMPSRWARVSSPLRPWNTVRPRSWRPARRRAGHPPRRRSRGTASSRPWWRTRRRSCRRGPKGRPTLSTRGLSHRARPNCEGRSPRPLKRSALQVAVLVLPPHCHPVPGGQQPGHDVGLDLGGWAVQVGQCVRSTELMQPAVSLRRRSYCAPPWYRIESAIAAFSARGVQPGQHGGWFLRRSGVGL